MKFGTKLRELREAKGMSREQLAEASGVPFGTIHGYEMSRRLPSLANVLALGKALGVDCTAFADCDDVTAAKSEPAPASKKKRKKT